MLARYCCHLLLLAATLAEHRVRPVRSRTKIDFSFLNGNLMETAGGAPILSAWNILKLRRYAHVDQNQDCSCCRSHVRHCFRGSRSAKQNLPRDRGAAEPQRGSEPAGRPLWTRPRELCPGLRAAEPQRGSEP